jgi:hypothetical protein
MRIEQLRVVCRGGGSAAEAWHRQLSVTLQRHSWVNVPAGVVQQLYAPPPVALSPGQSPGPPAPLGGQLRLEVLPGFVPDPGLARELAGMGFAPQAATNALIATDNAGARRRVCVPCGCRAGAV